MRALAVGSSGGEEIRLGEDRAWYEDARMPQLLHFYRMRKGETNTRLGDPASQPSVRPAGALRLAELGSAGGTLSVSS